MLFYTIIISCLVCCGLWQPVATYEAVCAKEDYFRNNCTDYTTAEILTTNSIDKTIIIIANNTNSTAALPTTGALPTTDMERITEMENVSIDLNSSCCYDLQMCMNTTFIDDNCRRCDKQCLHGCRPNDSSKCLCFAKIISGKENGLCEGYDVDTTSCMCTKDCKNLACIKKHELVKFIGIIIGIVAGVILIIVALGCLLYRFCCPDGPPPTPVQKPMQLTPSVQQDDFDDVYGNVNDMGEVKIDCAPESTTVNAQQTPHAEVDFGEIYRNVPASNDKTTQRLLPTIPSDGIDKGNNNSAFVSTAPPLPITVRPPIQLKLSRPDSLPDPLKLRVNLPKQSSIPESEPPPPPLPLANLLKKQLGTLPIVPEKRQIDDESIFGKVTLKSSVKGTSDYGDTYEMPNPNTRDFGGSYEIPNSSATDFGGSYEVPQQISSDVSADNNDFGGVYEIAITSPTTERVPDEDFDNTYEPLSPTNHSAIPVRTAPTPVVTDYGQEYEVVVINSAKPLQKNVNKFSSKKKIPPPVLIKPPVGKKPSGKAVSKPEETDYGDTYEAPMLQASGQPDYGGEYEAPMTENFAKHQDYGGDYEAPMTKNVTRYQDYGGDYEAPMLQDENKPEDYDCIYENTVIQNTSQISPTHREAVATPAEDYNQVYDAPYQYNHPVTFKGKQHGVYYNQPAQKTSPAVNKENYTKLYRT